MRLTIVLPFILVLAFGLIRVGPALAGHPLCPPPGLRHDQVPVGMSLNDLCLIAIPQRHLPQIQAQQTNVWCWAASAQAIFRFYGFDVPQSTIVKRGYNTSQPLITTGAPFAMLRTMNTEYTDKGGQHFTARIKKYYDAYSWKGNQYFASMASGLSWPEIYSELQNNHPIFYGDQNHAMVLIGIVMNLRHPQDAPLAGFVLDPAPDPRLTLPFSPITAPGVPAVGFRELKSNEKWWFMATVDVR